MTVRRNDQGFVRVPEPAFKAILARAAEEGANRALADVGLEGWVPDGRRAGFGRSPSRSSAASDTIAASR